MKYYLAKTDPDTYSIEQFIKDKSTIWDGVRNPQAVQVLKSMRKGDKVFIYHSMGETTIRGLARVEANLGADPNDRRSWLVRLKLIKAYKEPYLRLSDIKASGRFKQLPLIRQSRLSTMELTPDFIKWLKQHKLSV